MTKKCNKVEKNNKELEELTAKIEESEGAKLRALADLENYRRREEENKKNWSAFAVADFLKHVLPSFLEFELFAQNSEDKDAPKVVEKFFANLEKSGLKKISPQTGEDVNTDIHEVLMVEEGETGKIVRCLEPGWQFENNVLNPAKVTAAQ